jgi:hypothetical protein
MKTALQILAALMFGAAIIGLLAGIVLGEIALGLVSLISGLVFALILYAQSEIVDRLDDVLENQRRLASALNQREQRR